MPSATVCARVALLLALLAPALVARAAVLAHWTFNTEPSDNDPTTGTVAPAVGAGTIVTVGGVSATFAQGSNSDSSTTGNNNSSLNTSGYPGSFDGNKTAGIQIAVDTTGFEDIVLSVEHRHATGASAVFQIQYSTDGVNYTDAPSPYTVVQENVFTLRTEDFGAIAALDNNPNARFRVVAAFQGQAYSGTGGNYVPGANNRFDLVTVTGTPIPEPATAGLLLALLGLTARRRR